jgi:hypothetical protein
MDFSRFRLTFSDIIQAVCKRPRVYTLNGTFGEVLTLLDGYAYGAKLGKRNRSSSYFNDFAVWIASTRNYSRDVPLWDTFIKDCPDEQTAIREFARLWREYEESHQPSATEISNDRQKMRELTVQLDEVKRLFLLLEEFNDFFHSPSHYRNQDEVIRFVEGGAYDRIQEAYYRIVWKWLPPDVQEEIMNRPNPIELLRQKERGE